MKKRLEEIILEKIEITSQAMNWFINELGAEKGDFVQLYARYGGFSSLHAGFSLGVMLNHPVDPAIMTEKDGIMFYIEKKDEWYVKDHLLIIDVNEKTNELQFIHG